VRILSTVVLFTVAMTFVWVRTNRTTVRDSVHHTTDDVEPVAPDHGLMLASNTTHVEQEQVWNGTRAAIQEPAGERTPRHRPSTEYSRVTTWSRNDGVVYKDNRFEIGPSMTSENRAPMAVIRDKLIKKSIPHTIYHRHGNTSTVVDEHLNNETDTSSQVLHEMNIR